MCSLLSAFSCIIQHDICETHLYCVQVCIIYSHCLWFSIVRKYHNFLISSITNGHLDSFQYWGIINRDAMNVLEYEIWWIYVCIFVEHVPRNGIAQSFNRCIIRWSRYYQRIIQYWFIILIFMIIKVMHINCWEFWKQSKVKQTKTTY